MSGHISVKNFGDFQHYKDRAPPWIKLYNSLLDDYEFGQLPDASKAHLMAIWLLASRMENRVPNDAKWIAKKINATERVDIAALARAGFIVVHDASKPLAERKQDACLERETEERQRREETEGEGEGERQPAAVAAPPVPAIVDDDPLDIPIALDRTQAGEAVRAWNALAQSHNLPQIAKLTKQRRAMLAARLRDAGGLSGIAAALERVAASPFCLGQNDRGWRADIDWFLSERGFTRLMEGKFDARPNGIQADFADIDRRIDEAMRGTA